MRQALAIAFLLAGATVATVPPPPPPAASFYMAIQWAPTLSGEWKTVLHLPPLDTPGGAGFFRLIKLVK